MLEAIGFDNYRIFDKETIINLKPITILTGPNSSGKSSVIKAAKLLKQNSEDLFKGFPISLLFVPDQYGHFLGGFSNIITSTKNSSKHIERVSFLYQINMPALGKLCLGKITYKVNKKDKNKGALVEFSIIIKVNGEYETLLTLGVNDELFAKDWYYKINLNFKLLVKQFEDVFLPLLNIVKKELEPETKSMENKELANIIESLPHFKEGTLTRKYVHPCKNYFYEEVKAEKWLEYDSNKPILPYYKIINGKLDTSDISEEKCISNNLDYNNVIVDFINARGIELNNLINQLGFDPMTSLNNDQTEKLYNYFKNYDNELFEYINRNKIWLSLVHAPSTSKTKMVISHVQWLGISDRWFGPHDEDFEKSTDDLLKFKSLKTFLNLYDVIYFNSDIEIEDNESIILSFIESIILDSERQMSISIQTPFFFDSNRIEQTLFYHSTSSQTGYSILNDFYKPHEDDSDYIKNAEFVRDQLKSLGIAEDFKITSTEFGIYSVYLINDNVEKLLAEFGYGITKLFFLMLSINLHDVLFIEEPETNLHPDLQAKLADIIVTAQVSEGKQFIIETHSEYFIRKLQYLVAKNEIDSDNILINYFNPASYREKEGIVRETSIEKDGSLSNDFGPGFFDEALNWKFELMKLKNQN